MTGLSSDYPNNADESVESPVFDFSSCPVDPVLTLRVRYYIEGGFDGARVEIDRNDGNGFVQLGSASDPDWYDAAVVNPPGDGFTHLSGGGYRTVSRRLDGTAGNASVRLRVRLASDNSVTQDGLAFDDVEVICPTVSVSPTEPYFEDFENGAADWSTDQALWELGTPASSTFSSALSGVNAWMTNLDNHYSNDANTSVFSPIFDFSTTVSDPILSFGMAYSTWTFDDGLRVEIDLDDGQGWRQLGTKDDSNWYTGLLSPLSIGGHGFSGSRLNFRIYRHALDGAAGRSRVRIRFRFGSDGTNAAAGAVFDDVGIICPNCPGTAVHDDIHQVVSLDNVPANDIFEVSPLVGEVISIRTTSPAGELEGRPLLVVAELHANGAPPSSPFPGICVSGTSSTFLVAGDPTGANLLLPPGGFVYSFATPTALSGVTMLAQSIVPAPLPHAENGVFASTHATQLIFP